MLGWLPLVSLLGLFLAGQTQAADSEAPATSPQPAPAPEPAAQEPPAQAETTPAPGPYKEALEAIAAALGEATPVAIIQPEAIGAPRDLEDLSTALKEFLGRDEARKVIGPKEVFLQAGARFAASRAGLATVAARCGAQAAVFVRWIQSSEGVEIYPLVVGADGKLLLDQTFSVVGQAPVATSPKDPGEPAPEDPQDLGALDPSPQAPPSEPYYTDPPPLAPSGEQAFEDRKLTLADHPGRPKGFDVFQAGRAVGELDLARMVGRIDLVSRVEERVETLTTLRRVGIGLTLGGFAAAGLSLPLFKSGDDGLVAGSVVAGVGLATGVAGVVLWWLYGEEATRIGGPDPIEHLLTREEAEQAVRAYNGSLRKELGLPPGPGPVGLRWYLGPTRGGLAGGLAFDF